MRDSIYNLAPERFVRCACRSSSRAIRRACTGWRCDIADGVLATECPVLGICYGMYVIAQHLGAKSGGARAREYGSATLMLDEPDALFEGLAGGSHQVWMSHGDRVESLSRYVVRDCAQHEFTLTRRSRTRDGRMRGIQFHPEVVPYAVRGADSSQLRSGFLMSQPIGRWQVSSTRNSTRSVRAPARTIAS